MPIDLANVNISLQKFQAISSGKYNAGEIRITGRNSLGKVNNHVTKTGQNVTPLSHEEVMAVKTAFVKALSTGGVDREGIARVREELGLASVGDAVDQTLGQRSLKPLTRQQVREILDRYAATLNANARPGAARIRTSDELYARVSTEDRDARKARRDTVNASLTESRTVNANLDIQLFERLVAGDLEGLSGDDADRMAEMARQKLASACEKYGDNLAADNRVHVTWELPGGQKIDLLSSVSTADFVAYLEDTVFLLENHRPEGADGIVPPLTGHEWNMALRGALLATPPKQLPHAMRLFEQELLAEARAKFGADLIGQEAHFRDFIRGDIMSGFRTIAEAAGNRRLTPEDLRAPFRDALVRYGAVTLASRHLEQAAAARGVTELFPSDKSGFIERNADLLAAIRQADSPAAIAQVLENAKPKFETAAKLIAKTRNLKATIAERAYAALARKCNLPQPALAMLSSVAKGLGDPADALATRIIAGRGIVCETEEEAEVAFDNLVDTFTNGLRDQLDKAETVIRDRNLSPLAAASLRNLVCHLEQFKTAVFDVGKIDALVDRVRSGLDSLLVQLSEPNLSADEGLLAITTFVDSVLSAAKNTLPKIEEPSEKINFFRALLLIALNGNFAALAPLRHFFDRADVAAVPQNRSVAILKTTLRGLKEQLDPKTANGKLLPALGTPGIPPHHAAALIGAARDAGLTAMSEADILALFAPDKPAGKALAKPVAAAPVAVTPEMLQGFATGVLRSFAGSIHDGVASAALTASEADFPPDARTRAASAYAKAGDKPWKVDALIAAALDACGGDADVRALVLENLDRLLVGANAALRSEEGVRKRVQDLAANFAELRQLAANDQSLLAQGRELIFRLHANPLPKGFIGRLVQTAWEQPRGAMQGIGARSKGLAIHKAVFQFLRGLEGAFNESGAEDVFDGADQLAICKEFLLQRLLSGLSRADAEGIHAALHSQAGSKLLAVYGAAQQLAAGMDLPDRVRPLVGVSGNQMRLRMFELNAALCRHLGIQEDNLQPFEADDPPQPASFGAVGFLDDVVTLARERIAAAKKEVVNSYVRGNGAAAERLRGAFERKLGPDPASPESMLRDSFQTIVGTLLNRSVLLDMKNFATGQKTQFDTDRDRQYPIRLAGIEGEVSEDPLVARDQFAKFVTKNPAATYGSLTPQERNKANFAMSVASQGSHSAVASGFGVLLDPDGRSQSVGFGISGAERSFEMEIDHEGGLNVRFRSRQVPTMAVVDNVPTPCGAGSEVKMSLDLHVDAPEFNRLADLDFATYDDSPLFQAIDRGNETDKFRKAKNVFPPAFRFKIDVGPTVVANLL